MKSKSVVSGSTLLAAVAAFCVYTCMYAFRKPFTVAVYDTQSWLGIDYKIWLIIAQTLGYTFSKFAGISFIGNLLSENRFRLILLFILIAWIALFCFAIIPAPYNIIFLFINGLPLGVIYGLVFSYLEGRRSTELLGAVLASSFIFASGFAQSAGKFVMEHWQVSEWWMPFTTGFLFFPILIGSTYLLNKTPQPTSTDIHMRTQRRPMNRSDRARFIKTFLPGIFLLVLCYILLTILRDYRSNFAAEIWAELGLGSDVSVFTRAELPASILVLALMGSLILVKDNLNALLLNHLCIFLGFMLTAMSTLMFTAGTMNAFWWMTITGIGLYMGYVPFNCMLFERLIAAFKYVSNAGFIIYLADAFGYLGSDFILIAKNFMPIEISWSSFFVQMIWASSGIGGLLIAASAIYFYRKYHSVQLAHKTQLNYD